MKLNGSMLVAVAMMVGSMAATGCSKPSQQSGAEAIAPEQTVADAPVKQAPSAASPGVEQDERRIHYYAPHAPPVVRFEERGRAPSERHFWVPGYYRWSGSEHVWYGGRWEQRRDGYDYVNPHWENVGGQWEFIPGFWMRRG